MGSQPIYGQWAEKAIGKRVVMLVHGRITVAWVGMVALELQKGVRVERC